MSNINNTTNLRDLTMDIIYLSSNLFRDEAPLRGLYPSGTAMENMRHNKRLRITRNALNSALGENNPEHMMKKIEEISALMPDTFDNQELIDLACAIQKARDLSAKEHNPTAREIVGYLTNALQAASSLTSANITSRQRDSINRLLKSLNFTMGKFKPAETDQERS